MKKLVLLSLFSFSSIAAFSQTTVAFHQSNLPFIGVNYQFGNRFIPELRLGTDNYFEELSVELAANFIFKKSDRFEFYGGVGPRIGTFEGIVVPIGLNIYPFEQKDFGFHIEGTPILALGEEEGAIFRGSFGLRYRFNKN